MADTPKTVGDVAAAFIEREKPKTEYMGIIRTAKRIAAREARIDAAVLASTTDRERELMWRLTTKALSCFYPNAVKRTRQAYREQRA